MKTNIIEIHRLDHMGLQDIDYIVCDNVDRAEEIFQQQIKDCLKENRLTDEEVSDAMADDDNWDRNNNGDEVFGIAELDFWVVFIKGVERV